MFVIKMFFRIYLQFLHILLAQDYDVTSIQCSFATQNPLAGDFISAKLTKPIGFKGSPIFADDRVNFLILVFPLLLSLILIVLLQN